jgi:hypothetical protein
MSPKRLAVIGLLAWVAAIGSSACSTGGGGKPVSETPRASAFQQQCGAFCEHLRALGCPEGAPLASGTSCETFCIDTQEAGHDLHIACALNIRSCGDLQRCR